MLNTIEFLILVILPGNSGKTSSLMISTVNETGNDID